MVPWPPRNIHGSHCRLEISMILTFWAYLQSNSSSYFVSGILIILGGLEQEMALRRGKMSINVSGRVMPFVTVLSISPRASAHIRCLI